MGIKLIYMDRKLNSSKKEIEEFKECS